jgi:membrane-associated protease RseP (regulator of RpoE activity)
VGPLPPGHDLLIPPVAFAAWLGLLVTALNLVPQGQLDGGHAIYALLGRRNAERLSRAVSWSLLLCGLFLSFNWLVWWLLTRTVVGVRHPPALDEAPLAPGRRALAIVALLLFAATFVPVPAAF